MRRVVLGLLAACALACARPEGTPVAIIWQQDGYWRANTGEWVQASIDLSNVHDIAVYQFTGLPDADQDTLAQTFTLTLPGWDRLPGGSNTTANVSAVVSRHADPSSGLTAPIPAYRTVLLKAITLIGDPYDIVISGDLGSSVEATRRIGGAFNQAWRSSYWSGGSLVRTMLITVQLTSSTASYSATASVGLETLVVTETTARTGLVGSQYLRGDRKHGTPIIECPKTGFDVALDEAVRDGFTGKMVHPDGYDPPDRRWKRTPTRRPGESR